jgi:hypothetical protein
MEITQKLNFSLKLARDTLGVIVYVKDSMHHPLRLFMLKILYVVVGGGSPSAATRRPTRCREAWRSGGSMVFTTPFDRK